MFIIARIKSSFIALLLNSVLAVLALKEVSLSLFFSYNTFLLLDITKDIIKIKA